MTTERLAESGELERNYRQVLERIDAAASRRGASGRDVLMVAVTKHATPDQVRGLVELGHRDLGENRAQQLLQRAGQLEEFLSRKQSLGGEEAGPWPAPDAVRWHMIGHLQRNKIKKLVPQVSLIHSVDSLRLAEDLHAFGNKQDSVIDVLLQVNASGESSKYGLALPAVSHIAEQMDTMLHLRLRGLMTIAPYSENPEDARPVFARTAELMHELKNQPFTGPECNILSMGMSGDYEVAIEEGANVVRLGSALFGEAEA